MSGKQWNAHDLGRPCGECQDRPDGSCGCDVCTDDMIDRLLDLYEMQADINDETDERVKALVARADRMEWLLSVSVGALLALSVRAIRSSR